MSSTPGAGAMTVTARWNGHVIAKSDETVVVEGNHYFPIDAVADGVLEPSSTRSLCPWKGIASYFDVVDDDVRCPNGAFTYRHPSPFARRIKGRVSFWNGIEVHDDSTA